MGKSTTEPHQLDPIDFPLMGSRLIEASAGTGKTYTIAALYVRLVLGHGKSMRSTGSMEGATALHRPLLPSEILVMTFTKAATQELSSRIQSRLMEIAEVFRAPERAGEGDQFVRLLLLDYPEDSSRLQAAWQLHQAALCMDEASVFTIDAWCQKVLREHAVHTGQPFDEEHRSFLRRLWVTLFVIIQRHDAPTPSAHPNGAMAADCKPQIVVAVLGVCIL